MWFATVCILVMMVALALIILFSMADIVAYDGTAIANLVGYDGNLKATIVAIDGATIPSSPSGPVFDETWGSATPGFYTDDPITGADESGWLIDDGTGSRGVRVPNPASTYIQLEPNGGGIYLKVNDTGLDSTNNVLGINYYFPSPYSGAGNEIFLYNANADEVVCHIELVDNDEVYVNGTLYDPGVSRATWFTMVITVNHSAKTFTMKLAGTTIITNGAFWDGTGTDGDMCRLEIYMPNSTLICRLGRVYVSDQEEV